MKQRERERVVVVVTFVIIDHILSTFISLVGGNICHY